MAGLVRLPEEGEEREAEETAAPRAAKGKVGRGYQRSSHGNQDGCPNTASAPAENSWNSGRWAPRGVWEAELRAHPTMVHALLEHNPQKEPPHPCEGGHEEKHFFNKGRGGFDRSVHTVGTAMLRP